MRNLKQTLMLTLAALSSLWASTAVANHHGNMFTPGAPCTNCTIDISDHTGIGQTSKNAVYRVNNPATPNGTPPFLELYNPTLATIQNCAAMVAAVQGPTPFTVQLKASEYTLSGSNQVVFLIEKCRRVQLPPGQRPGMLNQGQPKLPGANAPTMGGPQRGQQPGMPQNRPGAGMQQTMPGSQAGMRQTGPGSRPGIANQGRVAPNTNCGSGTPPSSTSCATSGGGWQTVSRVLSEASCNLSYDDAVKPGRQQVIYDNTYSVTCAAGSHQPSVYVGNTPSQSNWGAFVNNSATCQMKTGPAPSGSGRVVEKIVCP